MKKVILKVGGMSCSACQNRVEKYLNKQDGVEASVNLVMAQAFIEYDEEKVSLDDLERFIKESGYESLGVFQEGKEEKKGHSKNHFILFGCLVLLLMYVSMSHMLHLPVIPFLHMMKYPIRYGVCLFLLTIPFLIFGFDILKSGIQKLIHKSPNMDSLVTIGVLASFLYSVVNLVLLIMGNSEMVEHFYFESTAMILYFIKLGRFIDSQSREKTKAAIQELVQITPLSAIIKTKNGEKEVTIDEVKKGDILICKTGGKVAVDGVIVKGEAHLEESFITGESIPAKKEKGDAVVAGSINMDGYFEYRAEKIGPDSTISAIVRLVVEAANTKAPIQRMVDVVSSYFVPGIMVIAVLTFLIHLMVGSGFQEGIIHFVTVLVVACPCALGLATPLAIVVSVGRSAKDGILIKSSEILENAQKCDTVVFDKTGTLTYGQLKISKLYNYSSYKDEEVLKRVASLEVNSSHPIANAFQEYFDSSMEVSQFQTLAGIGLKGVVGRKTIAVGNSKIFDELTISNTHKKDEEKLVEEGNSILYVIEEKTVLALIGVKDIVRENAKEVISLLKKKKKKVIMLSGDNEKTAHIIAKQLGIEQVIANVMPAEKEMKIQELRKDSFVMMVGDGINDAPSLVRADIGVSVHGGTDIAGDSADVILMQDDLSKILSLFQISQRTTKIIRENLFWAFFYNVLMIPIAAGVFTKFGIHISPMIASLSMTISSLCVVLNSLRLRGGEKK